MDDHSSGTSVAGRLARPTRMASAKTPSAAPVSRWPAIPIRSCSRWGLPCRRRYRRRGALLPHPFTLATRGFHRGPAVCSLWHCPWGRPRRELPDTVFPWSPDFPRTSPLPVGAAVIQPSGSGRGREGRARSQRLRPNSLSSAPSRGSKYSLTLFTFVTPGAAEGNGQFSSRHTRGCQRQSPGVHSRRNDDV